jgi:hypothetical protein
MCDTNLASHDLRDRACLLDEIRFSYFFSLFNEGLSPYLIYT